MPGAPILVGVTSRMDGEAIRAIVQEGAGADAAALDIRSADLTAVVAYFTTTNPYRGGGPAPAGAGRTAAAARSRRREGRRAAAARFLRSASGPTIRASAAMPATSRGRRKSSDGLPPHRYMSGYNVMATSTKPPYTTLTAYDLNTGEIKWQIAPGDHPPTVAAGGPERDRRRRRAKWHCRDQDRPRVACRR